MLSEASVISAKVTNFLWLPLAEATATASALLAWLKKQKKNKTCFWAFLYH